MVDIRKSLKCLVEKENCSYYDIDKFKDCYKNDEIYIMGEKLDNDLSCLSIGFLSKNSQGQNDRVRIIKNTKSDVPYVRFVFEIEDQVLKITVENDRRIEFMTQNNEWYYYSIKNDEEARLINYCTADHEIIKTNECNAQDIVDKIKKRFVQKDNPILDRLFEIVRPILALCVLEINIKLVKSLYGDIEYKKEQINELNDKLAKYDFVIEGLQSKKMEILEQIKQIEDVIDDKQYSITDEYQETLSRRK